MGDLEHTEDFATVTWRGREFTFSAMQRAAVKLLIENRGRALSQAYILERIGSTDDRLRNVFRSNSSKGGQHPAWGSLIELPAQQPGCPKDLYRVPRANPGQPPAGPQAISDPSVSGSSSDKRQGEEDMVSRLPADSNDLDAWLDGEIPALCSDLIGERNFTRALLRWGAIRQRASKGKIRAAADRVEAENLIAGLHYAVQVASRSESLIWLDEQLNALADAWSPMESPRAVVTCRDIFHPGFEEDGPDDIDLHCAAGSLLMWFESGDPTDLHDAHQLIVGRIVSDGDSETRIVTRMVDALRMWKGVQKSAVELADALEARDTGGVEAIQVDLAFPGIRQINEVWAK